MKKLWTKLSAKTDKAPSKGVKAYYAAVAAVLVGLGTISQVSALNNIAKTFKNTFSEIYSAVMVVASVIAVSLIAVCLLLRMLSKNPRTAEEATSWIKRIAITWLCLMLLNLFFKYGLSIVKGSGANTKKPWA